jgi:uncharacterized protein YbjQ (UPF0145 family)
MFCPKCGKQVSDDAVFCPNCRAQLKATDSTNAAAAPAASVGATQSAAAPMGASSGGWGLPMLFTANYVPGYKIDKVLGITYGITVRSRGLGGNIIAGLRTIGGGEIKEYTELAHQARQQALDRLQEHARGMGANAVISVMFDSTEVGNTMDEIIAFGTAVVVSPNDGATAQFVKLN